MFKNIAIVVLFELLLLILILGFTKNDLLYQTNGSLVLTKELISTPNDLKENQNYKIDHAMLYQINLQSNNGNDKAALLWPTEPFSPVLILVSEPDSDLKYQEEFQGRLILCQKECATNHMQLDMKDFLDRIEIQFPQFKDKTGILPGYILDTSQTNQGLMGYFVTTLNYWMAFLISMVASGVFMLMSVVFK